MIKKICAFIIIIFIGGCSQKNGPILNIDSALLEKINDTTTSSSFTIHNLGNKTLIIEDFVSSCDCTVPQLQKGDSVLPGKSLIVPIQFERTSNKEKKIITITLKTNTSPKLKTIKIVI